MPRGFSSLSIMSGFGPSRLGGAAVPLLSFSKESSVCPLCLNSYDELTTLMCGHGFCKRCLSIRTDGSTLKCPSCNNSIDLGDHGLDGLQNNYLINNILEIVASPDDVRLQSGLAEQPYFQLQRDSDFQIMPTPCLTCREDLMATKVSSLISNQSSTPDLSKDVCSKHQNEMLAFCCNTCIHPICRECIMMDHRNHNVVHIQEANQELRMLFPIIVNDLKSKGEEVTAMIAQVDDVLERIDARTKTVCSEIKLCVRQNIMALEEKERELLKQVEIIRKMKYDILQSQKDELKTVKNNIFKTASVISNAHRTSSNVNLIYAKKSVQLSINQIQADIDRLKVSHEDDQLNFVQRDHSFRSLISQLGSVASSISSVHTTASGQGIHCAIIGKSAKFLVTCRNHSNQRVNPQTEKLDVNIYGPDANPVNVELIGKHEGIFQFTYFPNLIGTYIISVMIRGRHILGSPLKAKVRKRRNYFNIGAAHHKIGCEGDKEGQLCRPWGACCDAQGHIVVADRSNNRVQVFNPDGSFKLMFGSTGAEHGQFNRPAGVAVNSRNCIIVTDKDNHRVQIFTFEGQFLLSFGERGSLNGQFHYPWDVACNNEDLILISDTRNHRIQLFSPEGQFLNKFNFHAPPHQRMQLPQPRGVCFTESGDILVTDFNKHKLMLIKSNFQSIQTFGTEGQGNGQFFRPQGVALDLEGNILVTEGRNNRVQIFRPDGSFLTKFGGLGTGDNEFDRPSGICVTPDGYIVVVDFGNNRIMFF